MGFFGDLFGNIKDGLVKKSFYFVITGVIAIITYFFAYNSGSNSAKYDCLSQADISSKKIEKDMREYRRKLDIEYQEKLDAINKSTYNNKPKPTSH